ncbi:uncharacterized protein LOC128884159 [Hylaeus volcanicus]|uniref:uncharacterized protein LOC128884159 n=1 Tax=Hylaeus volcanicus TaxID=313075 RepID=UPI0023B7E3E4|nr:uncharacterized protein LOC128884159 [Hylaeus volcanicus]
MAYTKKTLTHLTLDDIKRKRESFENFTSSTPEPFFHKEEKCRMTSRRCQSVDRFVSRQKVPQEIEKLSDSFHQLSNIPSLCLTKGKTGEHRQSFSSNTPVECTLHTRGLRPSPTPFYSDTQNYEKKTERFSLTYDTSSLRSSSHMPSHTKRISITAQASMTPSTIGKSRYGTVLRRDSHENTLSSLRYPPLVSGGSNQLMKGSSVRRGVNTSSERYGNSVMFNSTNQSSSAVRSINRTSSIASKRIYKDKNVIIPTTFENIVLDPTKFSSEKVRRDAALVILRCLHMKKYNQEMFVEDFVHCPSTQSYINLMQFLFSHIDPSNEPFILEEKVTSMFKLLGYPLQFAKSHFRSPCTPLMWPHHLASIAWLCALLIFDETVLKDLAKPTLQESQHKPTHKLPETPRVIGGFRCYQFEDEIEDTTQNNSAIGLHLKSGHIKSPYIKTNFHEEESHVVTDYIPCEPITVALVRTIQSAYMMYKQQGKEINEKSLEALLDKDIAQYRRKEEALLKESQAMRDAQKQVYLAAKGKLDQLGALQSQVTQQETDSFRLQSRIQTTEKLIEEKKRCFRNLQEEKNNQAATIFNLQKKIKSITSIVEAQGISKQEVLEYVEKTKCEKNALVELQKQAQYASNECSTLQKRTQQIINNIEDSLSISAKLLRAFKSSHAYSEKESLLDSYAVHYPRPLTFSSAKLLETHLKQFMTIYASTTATGVKSHEKLAQLLNRITETKLQCQVKQIDKENELMEDEIIQKLENEIDGFFEKCFNQVSWRDYFRELEETVEEQQKNLSKVKKTIQSSEKMTSTIKNSIQLNLKKLCGIKESIQFLTDDLKKKKTHYANQLEAVQEAYKISTKSFLDNEIQELKQTSQELRIELTSVQEKKESVKKRFADTDKRVTDRLFTWLDAVEEEIHLVLQQLQSSQSVVTREIKNVQAIHSVILNNQTKILSQNKLTDVLPNLLISSSDQTIG